MKCLTEGQLLASIDGGIAPNERAALDGHVAGCAACRASLQELEALVGDLAVLPEIDEEAHVKSVLARLDEKRPQVARTGRRRWHVVAPVISALAVAAGALLFVQRGPSHPDLPAFAARGGASEHTLARDVGVRLLTGTKTLSPLTAGAHVEPDAAFSATFTNVHESPAYLLLFAVDTKGEVHWLYPAYASAQDNPGSILLGRSTTATTMDTSVILEDVAPGRLRFLSVVTAEPLHVLDIEGLHASTLTKEALVRAYPQASIDELDVVVGGPQ